MRPVPTLRITSASTRVSTPSISPRLPSTLSARTWVRMPLISPVARLSIWRACRSRSPACTLPALVHSPCVETVALPLAVIWPSLR
ncbi:hypothetical protein D3C71_1443960 [compost metagenome]